MFVFRRSVRVDEDKPLALEMVLDRDGSASWEKLGLVALLLVVGAGSVGFGVRKRKV